MSSRTATPLATLLAILSCSSPATAHEGHTDAIEEVVVYGRAEQRIGLVSAASEGAVAAQDIRLPPLLRTGELVEAVPGMVATQHAGTGKANQYFLRGFNLDHGTDFSAFLDGVPINQRTHGHGQGYLDLNFLIPELVARTEFQKGPYRANRGDFSSAGSASFRYYQALPENLLKLTWGENDYGRALAAGSGRLGDGSWVAAADVTRGEGPWLLDEDLEQDRWHLGYSRSLGDFNARVATNGYRSSWTSTDQIPERAVADGRLDRRGAVDPTLGGRASRYGLNASLENERWELRSYLVRSRLDLFSNFTYLLEDPLQGDQFRQRDQRLTYGASARRQQPFTLGRNAGTLTLGVSARHDDIDDLQLTRSAARTPIAPVRDDAVEVSSVSSYADAELRIGERLRVRPGLRFDYQRYTVDARNPANDGRDSQTLVSPSLNLAWRASERLEFYGNWGRGHHSNDVRGASIRVDPVSGEPAERVDLFARSRGAELGVRFEPSPAFNASVTAFTLDLESELVFIGDGGATEPNGATERLGMELAAFWQPLPWLAMNLDYTHTRARFTRDAEGGGRRIPGTIASTLSAGLFGSWANGLSSSLRLRMLGPAPLTEDNSVRSDRSVMVNAGVSYRTGAVTVALDCFNLFDSRDADIAYFYASRLPGEPLEGVEDIHSHPLQPRTVRGSVTFSF
ncbi:MAG: TonB-dependent receptor [Pseudomonadota bacterium]